MNQPKYPHIRVRLVGEDGNALYIVGRVRKALRDGGVTPDEIQQFQDEATSGDYENLLTVVCSWVDAT